MTITANRPLIQPIQDAPRSVFYLPDFISREEEQTLLAKVMSSPKPKWVQLKNRRLQNWGGVVKNKALVSEPMPLWLTDRIFDRFLELGIFEDLDENIKVPNHCLVNEYLAGQGILPHKDGPAYLPTVATVSLASHCVLDFYKADEAIHGSLPQDTQGDHQSQLPRKQQPEFSILVQPRSLLVLKDDVYNLYMHGIDEVHADNVLEKNIVNLHANTSTGGEDTPLATSTLHSDRVHSQQLLHNSNHANHANHPCHSPTSDNDHGPAHSISHTCSRPECCSCSPCCSQTTLQRGTRISLTYRIVQKTLDARKLMNWKR